MRYFILFFVVVGVLLAWNVRILPIYDLSIERSNVASYQDGMYQASSESPKNIWYIGVPKSVIDDHHACVDWKTSHHQYTQCFDHDGKEDDQYFTFPVLTDASSDISFSFSSGVYVDPKVITVYSIDTRAKGSRIGFHPLHTTANTNIISRKKWGADETLRYKDHPKWVKIYEYWKKESKKPKTPKQIAHREKEAQAKKDRMDVLKKSLWPSAVIMSTQRQENGRQLVWPIQKVQQISRIVLHHTASKLDGRSDAELIRGIYAYHTISRRWGDIGYHYIVGQYGNIYEGRSGGDYTIGAHASYNNMGTVGLAVLGDFSKLTPNTLQMQSVERMITMLAAKYGITLSDYKMWFIKCSHKRCYPLKKVVTQSLLAHRDIGHTSCPWDHFYPFIPQLIDKLNRAYSPILNTVRIPDKNTKNTTVSNISVKDRNHLASAQPNQGMIFPLTRYIWPKFRVKLSYPHPKNITISVARGAPKLFIDKKRILYPRYEPINIEFVWNKKFIVRIWKRKYNGSYISLSASIVRIDSWDHVPNWDKDRQYNDNLYRDTLRITSEKGKMVIINALPLRWYLKGMWEVSNDHLPEKIKTIIVAARTYAKYYMNPYNRKFNTMLYDGSDNPDEFQQYLWYAYEYRSPNVAKYVDATRNYVIAYQWKLIKPWYFSSSDGRTRSALEYCQHRNSWSKNCKDIPYLQSVVDPGWVGKVQSWHGVGISWVGATYFANIWWDYKKIIQYYLKDVTIIRK